MADQSSCALDKQKCVPCEGGASALPPHEVEHLLSHVPGWSLTPDKKAIVARVQFKNFKQALAFVNKVGEIAESEGHHPDILFGWGYAEFILTTHAIDGLTQNDFIMANKISGLV